MKVASTYSHKGGHDYLKEHFSSELSEIYQAIGKVDASQAVTKISKEKTMPGQKLYSPIQLNKLFKTEFHQLGWINSKMTVKTTVEFDQGPVTHTGFRDMDFVKNKLGVEVQFGKYAFMVYNVAAKMTIFHRQKVIDAGVEIVPVKKMADRMSTGVSFFEQFKTDLEMRGIADIDIPVLIIGIQE